MCKYLVILTAPSIGFMDEPYDYIKPYIITVDQSNLNNYVEDRLKRKFALEFRVGLSEVNTIFCSKIK